MRTALLLALPLMLCAVAENQSTNAPIPVLLCTQAHPCEKYPALEVKTVPARPDDVQSIDGMMKAFYEVVSGPAGQPRDWARDRSLYTPDLRFISISESRQKRLTAMIFDHQTYAESSQPMLKSGFFEREIHRSTQRFGHIAHVMSTYESRRTPDGPVFARGINSIEMFFDGQRWWITFAEWDEERPGQPLPQEFLPEAHSH
jgi:hypothetical protein